jgi:hypothetical protein
MLNRVRGTFTYWSLLSLAIAVPVWLMVYRGSVLGREVDGGIFLSVSDGLAQGLNRYTDMWDNKDPFFGAAMAAASHVSATLPFFMDLLWIPLAAIGAYFIARSVASADRALFMALVVTPCILIGPAYIGGWANTPGTALVLLGWGMLCARRWVLAGIVLGLLLFVKITVWPLALLGLFLFLIPRDTRKGAIRALVAVAITVGISVVVMGVLGWIPGYIDMIGQNQAYSKAVITYFGFEDSPFGHIDKLRTDWPGGTWTGGIWIASATALVIAVAGTIFGIARRNEAPHKLMVAALLWVALCGTAAVLSLTYLWPHHAQALSLPFIVAAITFGSLISDRLVFVVWVVLAAVVSFVLSGWGSVSSFTERYNALPGQFDARVAAISEEPIDATLLNTVPQKEFTYARLGSNDDRGYLGSVREGAQLSCPQFHLYDFSPADAFASELNCIQNVDVVLKTANFDVFANGMNAANVLPILEYVNNNFDCLTINDRQLCTRR